MFSAGVVCPAVVASVFVIGIDEEGIATMQEYIESGRFTYSHYINMWSKRLEGLGVTIVWVPKGEEQSSFMQNIGDDNSMAGSHHTDGASESSALSTTTETEEDGEKEQLHHVLERDDAVVRAAEGVLQKLHEGDPDPTRP